MTKKTVFVLGALLAGVLLLVGVAYADNGPHGNYSALTDACAGCHRAHTAIGARLLIGGPNIDDFCFVCHGNTASGADTNVEDGVYADTPDGVTESPDEGIIGRGLKGGGFVYALMDTDWDGSAVMTPTSSSHLRDGSRGTVWGAGDVGSGAGAPIYLSCTSCHDPHGGASTTDGPTYRILRSTLPITGSTGVDVTDETDPVYTVSDNALKSGNQYFGEGYTVRSGFDESIDTQMAEISPWCTQCHTRYLASSGSGHTDSTDPIFAYRHMSQGEPGGSACVDCHDFANWPGITGGPMWNHDVECLTCHVAHGTSASMSGWSGSVDWPDGTDAPSGNDRSSLLRVDGRGTCQLCHGK